MSLMMSSTIRSKYSEVTFGTSGVRALVADLTLDVVASYTFAFVNRMRQTCGLSDGDVVVVAMDLRPSSPAIALGVCNALKYFGYKVEFIGALPTPALALHCLTIHSPGVMVTGSHIPFDRNGIKFYGPVGEILKDDEQAMVSILIPDDLAARLDVTAELPSVSVEAGKMYIKRYVDYFGSNVLHGLRVGVYEHSAVGRDLTGNILESLGATLLRLGRSESFVPIDTEAVSDADLRQAHNWCLEHRLDALVSTDGDGDRPLVFDGQGNFVRGDVLGLICSRALGIQTLVVPVSCNTVIEKSGVFNRILRTRIGSPYVIAGMNQLVAEGEVSVAGFEANGGFLLGPTLSGLSALPTRDAILPMISILVTAAREGLSIQELIAELPPRFTHSDRVKNIPSERSQHLLLQLTNDAKFRQKLFLSKSEVSGMDTTDGVRLTFDDGDIVHLRASGNAPELRCYTESHTYHRAKALCEYTLERII